MIIVKKTKQDVKESWFLRCMFFVFLFLVIGVLTIPIGIGILLIFISFGGLIAGLLIKPPIWNENCPHCSTELNWWTNTKQVEAFDCPICKKRVKVQENRLETT